MSRHAPPEHRRGSCISATYLKVAAGRPSLFRNLVANTASSGTTGLIGLTGQVVGNTVNLYAMNSTIGDTDQTYLYGIGDNLTATSLPANESFSTLATAAPDTNIRGVVFAPAAAACSP